MQALHTVLSFLILVSAVGTCLGQANQTCIHTGLVTPVHNFSVENFLGTWHGQKIYTGLAENAKPLEFRCLDIVFSRSESTFLPLIVEERFIENGTDTPTVLPDYVHISEENDAIWKIIGYYEGELLESDSVMVQTDYTNWAIQFGCSVRDNYRYETMQIWTRTRNPDPEVLAILEVLVKNYGFPSENGRTVEHTNC